MKIRASEKLNALDKQVNKLIEEIIAVSEYDSEEVKDVQKIWEDYRDERAEAVAKSWDGELGKD
jgi:hypothetical protein